MDDFDLFLSWSKRIPKYDERFMTILFDALTKKGGGSDTDQKKLGKHFNTNYELYIFCFFLGLYNNERIEIPIDSKKRDFSHAIENWGSKGNRKNRGDFTFLQQSMFIACIAKTEFSLIDLEKGILSQDTVVDALINTLESYTNGGLTILKEQLSKNKNFGLFDRAFIDLIFKTQND